MAEKTKKWIVTVVLTDTIDTDVEDEPDTGIQAEDFMTERDIINDVNRALKDKMPNGIDVDEVTAEEQ